jgi:hypothetical protein
LARQFNVVAITVLERPGLGARTNLRRTLVPVLGSPATMPRNQRGGTSQLDIERQALSTSNDQNLWMSLGRAA